MTRIFISGAGAFGTALALVFHKAGKDVTLISRNSTELVKNRTTAVSYTHLTLPTNREV